VAIAATPPLSGWESGKRPAIWNGLPSQVRSFVPPLAPALPMTIETRPWWAAIGSRMGEGQEPATWNGLPSQVRCPDACARPAQFIVQEGGWDVYGEGG
jgi:hypothetical protein